jgi:hypothetical protein
MLTSLLTFAGSFITKEFIFSIFKDVILEVILDEVDEFVADTKNPYDDQLAEKFREFIDNRED